MSLMVKLRKLRENAELSQNQLAKSLFIKQQTYSRYENGLTIPTFDVLQKIASFYNVPLDYFSEEQSNKQCVFLSNEDREMLKQTQALITRILKESE